jgi:hypothetical protein
VAHSPSAHTDFVAAFTDGQEFITDECGRRTIRLVKATELVLPTGRIVLCDPSIGREEPLVVEVPPGRYPVTLSLFEDDPVAVMVRFSDRQPVHWELALWPGQQLDELPANHFFGFGVDSATGCFVDASVAHHLPAAEVQVDELWAAKVLDAQTGANVVAYLTRSDGRFPSYWGFDDARRPTCLVTEITRLVTTDRAAAFVGNILDYPPGEVRHSLLDVFGLWLEVARSGKSGRDLVVALFGPRASGASLGLVDGGWNSPVRCRHVTGGSLSEGGMACEYVQWEVTEEAQEAALQIWLTVGDRRHPTVPPAIPPETPGVYGFLS